MASEILNRISENYSFILKRIDPFRLLTFRILKIFLEQASERKVNLRAINAAQNILEEYRVVYTVCTVGQQDTNELWSTMWPRYTLMNYDVETAARPEYTRG